MNDSFKSMLKKSFLELVYDTKYLLILFLTTIICLLPVNYYILVGGGISDINTRVEVEDGYTSKGSFNLSFVSSLDGKLIMYLLSFIMPGWERSSMSDYKYSEEENINDLMFRDKLDLDIANSNALSLAYHKANKKIEVKEVHYYVYAVSSDYSECKLKVGDEILQVNGLDFDPNYYSEYIKNLSEGDTITFKIIRNNKKQTVNTKIYKKEDKLLVGIALNTLYKYHVEPDVYINFKNSESGPSAGLMTTLSIYNQLVKKDITHGLKIAGTGTIDHLGNVGEIGGVEYKLIGAVNGKADVFIVPAGKNYETVKKIVKKNKYKIKIISVKTFDDCLDKLKNIV